MVVSSKLEYEDAIEFGITKDKLHVIPMGIDVDEYMNKPVRQNEDTINILFVGRIARVRRIEILLQAVAKLSISFHLTLVGGEEKTSSLSRSGYLDELKKLCKNLNINDRVTFIGPVAQDELFNWYSKGDIFVYPSSEPWVFKTFGFLFNLAKKNHSQFESSDNCERVKYQSCSGVGSSQGLRRNA